MEKYYRKSLETYLLIVLVEKKNLTVLSKSIIIISVLGFRSSVQIIKYFF